MTDKIESPSKVTFIVVRINYIKVIQQSGVTMWQTFFFYNTTLCVNA